MQASTQNTMVWLIDDDASIRWVLEQTLASEGIQYRSFDRANAALDALQAAVDGNSPMPYLLMSDIRMPGKSGLTLLAEVKIMCPQLPVVIMTAFSDLDSAVAAFQGGAYEYLAKPFDIDQALALVQRVSQANASAGKNANAAQVSQTSNSSNAIEAMTTSGDMLGSSPAMQTVFRAIGKLSHSNATVLVTGESGTGKELVARALHEHSPRKNGEFIALNTAAIPRDLLESELFGHERGAFTGAQTQRKGRFEQAEGGTLFLDEIGDMPADLQTRLLRVLSDGQYYRVGGTSALKANVRIIAATHQALETRVTQGLFREDLYHRLNVIRLRLPPLRERIEDIAPLAHHFLKRESTALPKQLSQEALLAMTRHPFTGNVRQLENLCHWLSIMSPSQLVSLDDLPPEFLAELPLEIKQEQESKLETKLETQVNINNTENVSDIAAIEHIAATDAISVMPAWQTVVHAEVLSRLAAGHMQVIDTLYAEIEKSAITAALQFTKGRKAQAANLLGLGRNTLSRKLSEVQ